jgi:superfamily II DNA or RNA helicase
MAEGIRRGLLCPFDYYGVPDEVDYANIPWRSRRFDEEALTVAVATRARAENALEQLRKHGKDRTVAFCASQRHAEFMAAFFREQGLRAVAVHAGPPALPGPAPWSGWRRGSWTSSAPSTSSTRGWIFPTIDTLLMLRPTESAGSSGLQQLGRGLRKP